MRGGDVLPDRAAPGTASRVSAVCGEGYRAATLESVTGNDFDGDDMITEANGTYQLFNADILKRGILIPVERDEDGNTLDGHHQKAPGPLRALCARFTLHLLTFAHNTPLKSRSSQHSEEVVTPYYPVRTRRGAPNNR